MHKNTHASNMSLLISFFEIFLALCGFIVLWRSLRGKKRRIKNWPVVGMLPEIILNINRVHDGFTELHDRCGGTFLFKVPWFEMLTTTDPANIQHIMTTSFSNYPKGPEFKKIFDVVGNGFSNADDDLWRNHRRVAQQLLTHNKFYQFLLKTTYDKVQNGLIPLLDHVSKQGLVVDLQDVFIRLTFDATCILVTGHDPGSLSVGFPDAPFPRALIDAEEAIFYRHAMPEKTWKLMRFLGIGKEKKLAKAVETLDNLICKCISTKRQENNGESIDLLTSYMDQENTQGWEIDDKLLRDTILNLMIAGQDTTASALTWFFWLLSENPSVETKIREELETTEPESDIEKLNKLVYLHAALCESLRLYPPVPFQLKTPLKTDILPSGHKVEPNTKVMLLTYSMGRMKRVWGKDFLEYKPERWISENGRIKYEPSYKFFAFNAGPRTCLGKQVAFTQLKTTAAAIIRNFDVEVIEGHCVAPGASIILHMKHGLMVRVTKRGYC